MITLTVNRSGGYFQGPRHKYKEVIITAQAISGPILAWLSRGKHLPLSNKYSELLFACQSKNASLLAHAFTFVKGECLSVRKKRSV